MWILKIEKSDKWWGSAASDALEDWKQKTDKTKDTDKDENKRYVRVRCLSQ